MSVHKMRHDLKGRFRDIGLIYDEIEDEKRNDKIDSLIDEMDCVLKEAQVLWGKYKDILKQGDVKNEPKK